MKASWDFHTEFSLYSEPETLVSDVSFPFGRGVPVPCLFVDSSINLFLLLGIIILLSWSTEKKCIFCFWSFTFRCQEEFISMQSHKNTCIMSCKHKINRNHWLREMYSVDIYFEPLSCLKDKIWVDNIVNLSSSFSQVLPLSSLPTSFLSCVYEVKNMKLYEPFEDEWLWGKREVNQ